MSDSDIDLVVAKPVGQSVSTADGWTPRSFTRNAVEMFFGS
jgi:hypothetical protein